MKIPTNDRIIIRDLAKQYRDYCGSQRNNDNKKIWEDHNALKSNRLIVMTCPYWHTFMEVEIAFPKYRTSNLQHIEKIFVSRIWQYENIKDDTVFDPWISIKAIKRTPKIGVWGYQVDMIVNEESGGREFHCEGINSVDDLDRLEAAPHEIIDDNPENVQLARELFGDIIDVHVNRSTCYPKWGGVDLSEAVGKLLGGQEMMLKLFTAPDLVHKLVAFMRDAVLANIEQCESMGDYSTIDSDSYMINHTGDLPKIEPNVYNTRLKDIWGFTHAQEFKGVSPTQHKEVLLNY